MNPTRHSIPVILISIFFCVFALSLTRSVRSFLYHKSVTPDLVAYLARPICDEQAATERLYGIMGSARAHSRGALRGLAILSIGSTSLFALLVYTLRRVRPIAGDTSHATQRIDYGIETLHIAELAFCLSLFIVLWLTFAYRICIAPLTFYIEDVRSDQLVLVKSRIFASWSVAELIVFLCVFVSAVGCVLCLTCLTMYLRSRRGMSSCGAMRYNSNSTSRV